MPQISVVIPLYNKEKSIKSTIYSVLNQSYKQYELIIVNDGSTDSSLNVVKFIQDNRIRIVTKINGGVSSARNKGILEARHDFIAFLDADDLWEKTFLENMCTLIHKCPEASLFGSSYSYLDEEGEIKGIFNDLPVNYMGYIDNYFKVALKNMLYNSSSSVYKKCTFNNLGLFDEFLSQGEDIDMWTRFALTESIAFYNKPLVQYRLGTENRAASRIFDRKKYLIWNLSRYAEYEKKNIDFKMFLDCYRLSCVREYLCGKKTMVNEIDSLLSDIDLKRFPLFWAIIKYMPDGLRSIFYKNRMRMYKIFQKMMFNKN